MIESELKELERINKAIGDFYSNHKDILICPYGYFTVDEYLENISYHLKKSFQHFNYNYPFKVEILERFKDKLILSYQPNDIKHGFAAFLFGINNNLHILAKVSCESRDDDVIFGVNLIFFSTGGLSEAITIAEENSDLINYDVFHKKEKKMGLSSF